MAEFIDSRTNLSVGPINLPPAISRTQIVTVIAAVLIWTPFLIKKLISGNTILHKKSAWMTGAIFVYFFSVSGMMFNVIRKMPLFLADKQDPDRLVFFYKGSGMQLGAEGFAVGFLYTVIGLLLAFVVHGLVWVSNRSEQRLMMMVAIFGRWFPWITRRRGIVFMATGLRTGSETRRLSLVWTTSRKRGVIDFAGSLDRFSSSFWFLS